MEMWQPVNQILRATIISHKQQLQIGLGNIEAISRRNPP